MHISKQSSMPYDRRDLLRVGSMSVGATALAACGETLPGAPRTPSAAKSVIYLWMGGNLVLLEILTFLLSHLE